MSEAHEYLGNVRVVSARPGLLQTFRAAHAVAEVGACLAVSTEEVPRYDWLHRYFAVRYVVDTDAPTLEIDVDHSTPRVRIGRLERPLLYAHAVFDAYRARWSPERPVRYSFAGLGTPERRAVIEKWADRNDVRPRTRFGRGSPELDLKFSRAGREWPEKAWDPSYVTALGRSQFALCPNGDFVWTYRFFEAAAAGAIPVIEEYCDLYDGFAFHTFDDRARAIERSDAAVEHNAALVRQRLTASADELVDAVRCGLRSSSLT